MPSRWYTKRQYQKFTRQRPIKGGRESFSAGLEQRINDALDVLCVRYHVTRPRAASTILADALNVPLDPEDRYDYKPAHVKKG